jgi:hypothetical protein
MTQSNAERQRLWRERMKSAGYRAMLVWLPLEAVDILSGYPERERGQIILNALRNATSNTLVMIPGNEKADTGPPAMLNRLEALEGKVESLTAAVQGLVTGNTPVTLHSNNAHEEKDRQDVPPELPKVADTGTDNKAKVADTTRKAGALTAEELARAAQTLHKQGLSYAQIADQWEKEKVPTLKGGRWHKGTIGNLVQRYCVERSA